MLNEALAQALVAGDNVLAIHCRNVAGGQFIDAGIEVGVEVKTPQRPREDSPLVR